jgi:hypothetical protein
MREECWLSGQQWRIGRWRMCLRECRFGEWQFEEMETRLQYETIADYNLLALSIYEIAACVGDIHKSPT